MNLPADLRDCRIVRLNGRLFPPGEHEELTWRRYGIKPEVVEADTPEELIPQVRDADAVYAISVALPTAVIESMERCRVISRLGTGTDKIDVARATEMGIVVTNVPYFCVEEQTDHAMAMLLTLARRIHQTSRTLYSGSWSEARRISAKNRRIRGRVLGIVGFGHTGQALAKRARAFDMRVLGTRRNLESVRRVAAELGVELVDLETLLRESDFVSLHVPLGPDTYHLIDERRLRMMKPDAFLINTARGAVVDEMALVAALREGRLAGAGIDTYEHIDVFTREEGRPDHPLLDLDNVLLTPHVAALSVEAKEDVNTGGTENVVAVLNGYWPLEENIVNVGVKPREPLRPYDAGLFERVLGQQGEVGGIDGGGRPSAGSRVRA